MQEALARIETAGHTGGQKKIARGRVDDGGAIGIFVAILIEEHSHLYPATVCRHEGVEQAEGGVPLVRRGSMKHADFDARLSSLKQPLETLVIGAPGEHTYPIGV